MNRTARTQKLMVLGIDGMDPVTAGRLIKEGKLPNIQKFLSRFTGFYCSRPGDQGRLYHRPGHSPGGCRTYHSSPSWDQNPLPV